MKPADGEIFRVLTCNLLATDCERLMKSLEARAGKPGTLAVDFVDTQFVVLRQRDLGFARVTDCLDVLVPASRSLVWAMKRLGSTMSEPIDGSLLMRELLFRSSSDFRHYFIGESEECHNRLRDRLLKQNPDIDMAGFFHGACSPEGYLQPPELHDSIVEDLLSKEPHFVWVGLETPKQYAFIANLKRQLHSGILLAMGFAFEVNAGMRRDVPLAASLLGHIKYSTLFFLRLLRSTSYRQGA
jgi:N-acetylglucosaminyldiphosphoundecaprenol N-acetyl-beta-D-mannosaminyltransferase